MFLGGLALLVVLLSSWTWVLPFFLRPFLGVLIYWSFARFHSIYLWAPSLLLHIFSLAPTCTNTNYLEPCALDGQVQHFIPKFNKTSLLCGPHSKEGLGGENRPWTGEDRMTLRKTLQDRKKTESFYVLGYQVELIMYIWQFWFIFLWNLANLGHVLHNCICPSHIFQVEMWRKSSSQRNAGIDASTIYMSSARVLTMFIMGGNIWNMSLYDDNLIESHATKLTMEKTNLSLELKVGWWSLY